MKPERLLCIGIGNLGNAATFDFTERVDIFPCQSLIYTENYLKRDISCLVLIATAAAWFSYETPFEALRARCKIVPEKTRASVGPKGLADALVFGKINL